MAYPVKKREVETIEIDHVPAAAYKPQKITSKGSTLITEDQCTVIFKNEKFQYAGIVTVSYISAFFDLLMNQAGHLPHVSVVCSAT